MDKQRARQAGQPRHREILEEIQALIRASGLKAGDRLPSERAMAATFQASRNSVREAVRALIEKGLLTSRRGAGTYLESDESTRLLNNLGASLERQRQRLQEIFQFRRLLEPEIAALAATVIRVEDLDRLKLAVFDQERCLVSGLDDSEYDRAFHLGLAQATGNRIIREVVHILEGIVGESRARDGQNPERRRASVQAHIHIIEALQSGDQVLARQAMSDHLEEVEEMALSELPEG